MEARLQTHLDDLAIPEQRSSFDGDAHSLTADGFDDPIFLAESWTLGRTAAVESLRRRRQIQADRENQARTFRIPQNFEALRSIEDREGAAEARLQDRAATIVDHYDATSSQSWTPRDWTPEDRIAQSWIPQGWTPRLPHHEPQQPRSFDDRCGSIMTTERACLLLEVTSASTHEQVRSAYRRMVGQWHPDRLQFTTEAVRVHATQHMAALNEAYRLLSAILLEQAA